MLQKSRLMRFLLIPAAFFVVAGCATLPEPGGESDTAFAFPVQRQRLDDGSTFGYYEVHLGKPGDPDFRKVINVYANSDLKVITGLEPGSYTVARYQFRYKNSGSPGSSRSIDMPFMVEAGAITISTVTAEITIYKKDEGSSKTWMRGTFPSTTEKVREEVLEELRQEESFSSWEVLSAEESSP